jgi:hypothetical protein
VSESGCRNVTNGSAVEALGAPEPKKRVKAARRRVGVWWKGCRKQVPKAPFRYRDLCGIASRDDSRGHNLGVQLHNNVTLPLRL